MCEHGTTTTLLIPLNDAEPGKPGSHMDYRLAVRPVDACIADLVRALNAGGIPTTGSCCGHGKDGGDILLLDGRVLRVTSRDGLGVALPPTPVPREWESYRHARPWFEETPDE